ncbi:hypothetical protein ACRU3B_10620 [Mycobacterium colombiense]
MASNELQVVLDELRATATQWQGLSAQLTGPVAPLPGPPFQPTTAAVNGVNAALGAAAAAFATRTKETAGQVTNAAAGYGSREATSAKEMADVTKVTVV